MPRVTVWFRRIVDELTEDAAYMAAHVVRVVVLLALEFGLSWILALPQLRAIAPVAEPILKCVIPLTVVIFCCDLVFILTHKAWQEVRRRTRKAGEDWRTVLGIFGVIAALAAGGAIIVGPANLLRYVASSEAQRTGGAQKTTTSQNAGIDEARIDLSKFELRSGNRPLSCPLSAQVVVLLIQVPVESGFVYFSQFDQQPAVALGFRADGLFEHRLSHTLLSEGRHRVAIYKSKFGDSPTNTQIKSLPFDFKNDY